MKEEFRFNKKLKFSWGHIFAFVALICICYFTFAGSVYKNNGNFAVAILITIIIFIFLAAVFFIAQLLKSTDHNFHKRIKIERVLVFVSPIVFIICMLPYFHFWTVNSKSEEIVKDFKEAINSSKQMFADYDKYTDTRINNYNEMLQHIIDNKKNDYTTFTKCGFENGKEYMQKDNMLKTLELQLLSTNYSKLKDTSISWIDENSNRDITTFNVFLLGNAHTTKEIIHGGNDILSNYAEYKLSNEEMNANKVETFNENTLAGVDKSFNEMETKFLSNSSPTVGSIFLAILLYGALLLPYIIQDRNDKTKLHLLSWKYSDTTKTGEIIIEPPTKEISTKRTERTKTNNDQDDFTIFRL